MRITPGDDMRITPGDDMRITPGDDMRITPGDDMRITPGVAFLALCSCKSSTLDKTKITMSANIVTV